MAPIRGLKPEARSAHHLLMAGEELKSLPDASCQGGGSPACWCLPNFATIREPSAEGKVSLPVFAGAAGSARYVT